MKYKLITLVITLLFSLSCLPSIVTPTPRPPTSTPVLDWGTTGPPLDFEPLELPEAQLGEDYEVTITVVGYLTPVAGIGITTGALPEGLVLDYEHRDDFATISGTPLEAGAFVFIIRAGCLGTNVSGQEGFQEYTLVVHEK